jgi:hypothetical protein
MIDFIEGNLHADLMIVHRFIARGLERMAGQDRSTCWTTSWAIQDGWLLAMPGITTERPYA